MAIDMSQICQDVRNAADVGAYLSVAVGKDPVQLRGAANSLEVEYFAVILFCRR